MSEQSQGRTILNANQGIANFIDSGTIRGDLQQVADKLFNILSTHYGPFSGLAALENGDPTSETEFTKDGIKILRALELASPQENWMRKTIAYIGTKMETAVGDGTTSAMMFTAAMLKHMLLHIDEIKPISYNELRGQWDDFLADISDRLEHERVMPETRDLTRRIVYNQVYTSSHGDIELAKAMAKVYDRTPKELWNRMVYQRRTYESEERFYIDETEGQWYMPCDVMMNGMLNKDFSTWFQASNCTLYVMNDCVRQDCESWDRIIEAVQASTKEKPFVLVSHKRMSTNAYQEFLTILNDAARAGKCVAIFQTDPPNPRANDFVALQLLCGTDVTKCVKRKAIDAELTVVEGVDVMYKNHTLYLDKLYEEPDYSKMGEEAPLDRIHGTDGQHLQYTDYLEGLKNLADGLAKKDNDEDAHDEATRIYRLFAKLKYRHTVTLQIGGKALDNIAFTSVVDDCVRAASKALTNGVVHGNNKSLYKVIKDLRPLYDLGCRGGAIHAWFADRIIAALEDIAAVVPRTLLPGNTEKWYKKYAAKWVPWWMGHNVDLLEACGLLKEGVIDDLTASPWYDNPKTDGASLSDALQDKEKNWKVLICQPTNSDISMLERFGEVALKYILTERIIIHNAAYVDKSRSKK